MMKALELGERAGHRKELLAEQGAPGPVPAGAGFPEDRFQRSLRRYGGASHGGRTSGVTRSPLSLCIIIMNSVPVTH